MSGDALLDSDCRAGKHGSCVGGPCECGCHTRDMAGRTAAGPASRAEVDALRRAIRELREQAAAGPAECLPVEAIGPDLRVEALRCAVALGGPPTHTIDAAERYLAWLRDGARDG